MDLFSFCFFISYSDSFVCFRNVKFGLASSMISLQMGQFFSFGLATHSLQIEWQHLIRLSGLCIE